MTRRPARGRGRIVTVDTVAAILAGGVIVVLSILATTSLVDATRSGAAATRPSENLTQILATVLGGIVGALAAYLGAGRVGARARHAPGRPRPRPRPAPPPLPVVTELYDADDPITPPYGTPAVERASPSGEPVGP